MINTEPSTPDIHLDGAICLYRVDHRNQIATWNEAKGGQLGAGTPLDRAALRRLLRDLTQEDDPGAQEESGFVDPNLVYESPTLAVWRVPRGAYTLNFQRGGADTRRLLLPTLLLAYNGRSVFAAATKDDHPDASSELYQVPLPNIRADGTVCMGGGWSGPQEVNRVARERVQEAFLISRFSHVYGRIEAGSYGVIRDLDDLFGLYDYLGTNAKRYPKRFLSPFSGHRGSTVERWVKSLEGER